MKKQTCCFTGHRKIPSKQYEGIVERLPLEITAMIHQGVIYFETGGALGFDTRAAQAVLFGRLRLFCLLSFKPPLLNGFDFWIF